MTSSRPWYVPAIRLWRRRATRHRRSLTVCSYRRLGEHTGEGIGMSLAPPDLAAHPIGGGPGPYGAVILTLWTPLNDGVWRRADGSRAQRHGPRPPQSARS